MKLERLDMVQGVGGGRVTLEGHGSFPAKREVEQAYGRFLYLRDAVRVTVEPAGVDPGLLALTGAPVIGGPQPDGQDVALKSAISEITVPSPPEEREALHARLSDGVRAIMAQDVPFGTMVERIVAAIMAAGDKWEAGIAKDRDTLRKAAEAYFGEDFSKPEAT